LNYVYYLFVLVPIMTLNAYKEYYDGLLYWRNGLYVS